MQTGWQQEMPTLTVDYGDNGMSEWLDIGPTVEGEDGWGWQQLIADQIITIGASPAILSW